MISLGSHLKCSVSTLSVGIQYWQIPLEWRTKYDRKGSIIMDFRLKNMVWTWSHAKRLEMHCQLQSSTSSNIPSASISWLLFLLLFGELQALKNNVPSHHASWVLFQNKFFFVCIFGNLFNRISNVLNLKERGSWFLKHPGITNYDNVIPKSIAKLHTETTKKRSLH